MNKFGMAHKTQCCAGEFVGVESAARPGQGDSVDDDRNEAGARPRELKCCIQSRRGKSW